MLRVLRTADSDRSSISGADDDADDEAAEDTDDAAAPSGIEAGLADIVEEGELI